MAGHIKRKEGKLWFFLMESIIIGCLWMLCVNGKVDESEQVSLLIFREISGRKMKELGSGSFIEIVILDVD
jgi:hypothetical protein